MSKLSKAIRHMREAQGARESLAKSLDLGSRDLRKGIHDAMFHHAECACAANRAGKEEVAKAHTFMFMRHALENARKAQYASSMIYRMRASLEFYQEEASNAVPWNLGMGPDGKPLEAPLVKYFRDGGAFKAHADDRSFIEDYDGGKKPKL